MTIGQIVGVVAGVSFAIIFFIGLNVVVFGGNQQTGCYCPYCNDGALPVDNLTLKQIVAFCSFKEGKTSYGWFGCSTHVGITCPDQNAEGYSGMC